MGTEKGIYYKKEIILSRNGLEIMGNETRACEYWRKEEEKICRLCGKENETMKHVLKECEVTENRERDWTKYLKGDTKSLGKLNEVIWKRKRKESQSQEGTVETL